MQSIPSNNSTRSVHSVAEPPVHDPRMFNDQAYIYEVYRLIKNPIARLKKLKEVSLQYPPEKMELVYFVFQQHFMPVGYEKDEIKSFLSQHTTDAQWENVQRKIDSRALYTDLGTRTFSDRSAEVYENSPQDEPSTVFSDSTNDPLSASTFSNQGNEMQHQSSL
eukprot:PhF_6_TR4641/c0_g2_i1/m.6491